MKPDESAKNNDEQPDQKSLKWKIVINKHKGVLSPIIFLHFLSCSKQRKLVEVKTLSSYQISQQNQQKFISFLYLSTIKEYYYQT